MSYLPLPEPWTIETLPQYVNSLVDFVNVYGDISRFNTHDVFTKGLPVDWAPEYPLKTWIAIISGNYTGRYPDSFSRFAKLSQELPLIDVHTIYKSNVERKHKMSPKKSHEVDAMITFLEDLINKNETSAKSVLDVGSGLGYLSSQLAEAGYNVVGVEGDQERAKKAAECASFKSVHKMIDGHADLDLIKDPCISLSLHACGDLSLSMIQHFLFYENVRILVNVGCCYNRLSADGFPISQLFKERGIQIDQPLRQLAVQTTNRWTSVSLSMTTRKHYYRALLQLLFDRYGLNPTVGKLPDNVYQQGFDHYIREVVRRGQLPSTLIDGSKIINKYADHKVMTAVCMRAMCAAVIESLIVLDRWIALREKFSKGYIGLHRVFDPQISPRSWAIVGVR